MKSKFLFTFSSAVLAGAVFAFSPVAQAATIAGARSEPATKGTKITTETSYIGPATEQVVVTEKYKDGTVIRVVQIIHRDGSSETTGERHAAATKS